MARFLIVDDDADIRKIAERLLTHAGHQAVCAADAMSAMEHLNLTTFDVMISDANMPVYSGFELVKTVRTNPKYSHMAVAMLTGLRERKAVDRAVKAGVDDYIVKPIDPMLFLQKVNALLEKSQPVQKPEIRFVRQAPEAQAKVSLSVQLEAASELGLVFRCSVPLEVGQTLDLSALFFQKLDAVIPPLKVLRCEPTDEPESWQIEVVYLGASEAFLQRIRKWIFTHGASNRAAS